MYSNRPQQRLYNTPVKQSHCQTNTSSKNFHERNFLHSPLPTNKTHPLTKNEERVTPLIQHTTPDNNFTSHINHTTTPSNSCSTHTINNVGEIGVHLYNKYKACLVDSGALRSCVSLKTYDKLPKYKQKLKPAPNLNLCGADQQPLSILGEVDLELNLRGFLVNYSFVVVKDLVNPIIIGADLLSHTKAAIHYGTRTVTFFDNLIEIDMNFKRQTLDGHVLCLAKSLTVPARCAVLASI